MSEQRNPSTGKGHDDLIERVRKARRDHRNKLVVSPDDFPVGRILVLEHKARNGYMTYFRSAVVDAYRDPWFKASYDHDTAVVVRILEATDDKARQCYGDHLVAITLDGDRFWSRLPRLSLMSWPDVQSLLTRRKASL